MAPKPSSLRVKPSDRTDANELAEAIRHDLMAHGLKDTVRVGIVKETDVSIMWRVPRQKEDADALERQIRRIIDLHGGEIEKQTSKGRAT